MFTWYGGAALNIAAICNYVEALFLAHSFTHLSPFQAVWTENTIHQPFWHVHVHLRKQNWLLGKVPLGGWGVFLMYLKALEQGCQTHLRQWATLYLVQCQVSQANEMFSHLSAVYKKIYILNAQIVWTHGGVQKSESTRENASVWHYFLI